MRPGSSFSPSSTGHMSSYQQALECISEDVGYQAGWLAKLLWPGFSTIRI